MMWLFLFLLLAVFGFFWRYPKSGLYLAVFLAPFLGLVMNFSFYDWARGISYLGNIDGPIADFAVLILLAVVVVKTILRAKRPPAIALPKAWRAGSNPVNRQDCRALRLGVKGLAMSWRNAGFFYFLPFLFIGFFSLINAPYDQLSGSIKYLLRPILFFYVMWIWLMVFLIDSEAVLRRVLKIMLVTGLIAAVMGMISLIANPSIFGFWRRAGPIEFWGIAPLGYNHNLLAEVLVAAAPVAFYLFSRAVGNLKKFYFFSSFFILAVALLTFSRAAWLALAGQGIIYLFLIAPKISWRSYPRKFLIPALIILPLFFYLMIFSASPMVRSSNATRLDLTGIAWTYFKMHPWLGNGVGAFVPLVEQTRLFTVEYGDPLDAHGIIQKLLAEQGLLGVITFFVFASWVLGRVYGGFLAASETGQRLLMLCLFLSVVGGLIYQLFNTSYYNAHLWLPVGVALAATAIVSRRVVKL